MKNYKLTIEGTQSHINAKKSETIFNSFEKALKSFNEWCFDNDIQSDKVDIDLAAETASTSVRGFDYCASIEPVEV